MGGFARRAYSRNSCRFFTGNAGLHESTIWVVTSVATGARSFSVSTGRFAYRCGLMTIWLSCPRSSVYPSGAALATSSLERLPLEPGRFSTTTGWPSASPSRGETTRAIVSVAPPGGLGTNRRIGRLGYCAQAAAEHRDRRSAATTPEGRRKQFVLMVWLHALSSIGDVKLSS